MEQNLIKEIITSMAITARVANIYSDAEEFKDNKRYCPFYSELVGMEHIANILGIPFEYEFNEDYSKRTAIISGDMRIAIE